MTPRSLTRLRRLCLALTEAHAPALGAGRGGGARPEPRRQSSLSHRRHDPLGLIAFLAQHDSYHLGQLAFLRWQLGHPAMSYTRGPT
jgi:uncharacterized damage-inducible protein DinB